MAQFLSPKTENRKPKTLIIYDCDGVLIDSREANRAFYNDILAHFGLPRLTEEQLDFVQVSTSRQAVDLLFKGTPFKEMAQAYQLTLDNERYLSRLRLEPHVHEVLAALRPGFRTAVATNRGRSLGPIFKHFHLDGLFDFIVSSYDVSLPKPHPECLLKVLDHFQAPPRAALYIGDAEVDRLVAQRAGVDFAAYKNPGLAAVCHLADHLDLLGLLGF
jgi:HAD superfamily hydrolase (TIGR01509 family)